MKDFKNVTLVTTITDKCKKDKGNDNGFYDGEWMITEISYRYNEVELSNSKVCIGKFSFDEINPIRLKEE